MYQLMIWKGMIIMVEIINRSVCRGIAGRRASAIPDGTVWHNDAGSIYATAKAYVESLATMTNAQLGNGFAHYYVDRFTRARVEDTYNKAWHTASNVGNDNYVGFETCQSLGASDEDFLANEQETLKQIAEDFVYWKKTPDRSNFRLHCEFVPTACPHRSMLLHTGWNPITQGKAPQAIVDELKDYGISQVKKYMQGEPTTPEKPTIAPQNKPKFKVGDKVVLIAGAKNWNSYRGEPITPKFSVEDMVIPFEVKSVSTGNLTYKIARQDYQEINGWVDERHIAIAPTNDIKPMDKITLRRQASNWVGGDKINETDKTENGKSRVFAVKERKENRLLIYINGWERWAFDWDCVPFK